MKTFDSCACDPCKASGKPVLFSELLEQDNSAKTIRTFPTGATRDTSSGKYEYSRFMDPKVIKSYAAYMHKNRLQKDGTLRDPDNWKKGIPVDAYMSSLWRHMQDIWEIHTYGEAIRPETNLPADMEETLCALLFNTMGYLYEYLNRPPND